MRKIFGIVAVFLMICTSEVFAASKEVKYQVDKSYPPFTYTHKNYLYGFDPDFTNLLFNTADYEVDFSVDDWSSVYQRLVKGDIDIGGIIAVTEERKKEVLFSDTLFTSYVSVYTRANFRKIGLEDLKSLRVGVGKGYYTETLLRNKLKVDSYTSYNNIESAIYELESGRIDVIFENQQLMDNILVKTGSKGEIIAQSKNLFPMKYAYAIGKKRQDLVTYINRRIKELKSRGVFEEVYLKYFYVHSGSYYQTLLVRLLIILIPVGIIIIAVIVLVKLYISRLEKKVQHNYELLLDVNTELSQAQEKLLVQYDEINSKRKELSLSEERYRLVVEGANDGLWDWNALNDTGYLSEKWRDMLGYYEENIDNYYKSWEDSIHPEDKELTVKKLRKCMHSQNSHYENEYRIRLKDGSYIWVLAKGKILRNSNGCITRIAGSYTDITEQRAYESNIFRMAYYDSLTNLPNRLFLNQKLYQAVEEAKTSGKKGAVYYIDLDNFKHINDTLGHDFGDMVLKKAGEELIACIGGEPFVARLGGDEYVIVIDHIESYVDMTEIADRIMRLFSRNWNINSNEMFISVSMGITIIPDDGTDARKLLKNADTAMYAVKDSGKGRYKFFNEEMLNKMQNRIEIEKSLRKAIENNEFVLYYQPYFNAETREIAGLEALLRWVHPEKGMIMPSEFITIAEETGLINTIGRWVIREACRQNKKWQSMGMKNVSVAINISEVQLQSTDFAQDILNVLSETKLNPQFLELEITESSIMESVESNIEVLKQLNATGIKISLDDFGTGYSSLSYIQILPLNTVKIDKCFIDAINTRDDSSLITGDIVSIAHKLCMQVIAEGVETKEQLDYLVNKGCDKIQGYLLSKPLSSSEIEELLKNLS